VLQHPKAFRIMRVSPCSASRLTGSTSGGVGLPPWLVITLSLVLLILAVAGPIWTARRLLRRAGESPAQSAPALADPIPA
jgi:hypothetical protein